MTGRPSGASPNVLVSSAGRRVGLVGHFREAAGCYGGRVVCTDMSPYAPALQAGDVAHLVPPIADDGFVDSLLEVVSEHDIGLLVPTLDTELEKLAAHRAQFAAAGCTVALGDPTSVAICADKVATHEWFVEHDVPTVVQSSPEKVMADPAAWRWPLIVKPARGSASEGVRLVHEPADLGSCVPGDIVQSLATGDELTVDVYVDRRGTARTAVPRQRLEVRAGEVSKAVTVNHRPAAALAERVASLLPGVWGAVTVQLFADGDVLAAIEVNPRFGGGYPLSWAAGARFPLWMIQELVGEEPSIGAWEEGLTMLRYDDAYFVPSASLPPGPAS